METYLQTKKLKRLLLRVDKQNSSFLYFTLESNEGIAFYSTTPESLRMPYRDIDLYCTPEYFPQVHHLVAECTKSFPIEILVEETIQDQNL